MPFSFYDNASSGVLNGIQSTLHGVSGAVHDIDGCTVTLTAGTWIVCATWFWRNWQPGTAYSKAHAVFQLTDSANSIINGINYADNIDTQNEQRADSTFSITTTIGIGSSYVVKMRGQCYYSVGSSFAAGFRWDSGLGSACTLRAIRVGP